MTCCEDKNFILTLRRDSGALYQNRLWTSSLCWYPATWTEQSMDVYWEILPRYPQQVPSTFIQVTLRAQGCR